MINLIVKGLINRLKSDLIRFASKLTKTTANCQFV